jgi:methionyl-tRNA formyltransferase
MISLNHPINPLAKKKGAAMEKDANKKKQRKEKFIFMGSPGFALPALEKLYEVYADNLAGVFTRPDKPRGRGKKPVATPIKIWAESRKIPVFEPSNKMELEQLVMQLEPTLIVVVAYGMILPKKITDTFFCLNIHASLLPKYRGASPIQTALLNNEKDTGITLMKINEKMDTGDILGQAKIDIDETDNYGSLHNKLANLGAELFHEFMEEQYVPTKFDLKKQNEGLATYCKKINKEDLLISIKTDPKLLLRKIKAFSPSPCAYIIHNDKRIKIVDATVSDGKLNILLLKPEGKKVMSYKDYCLANASIN